MYTNLDYAGGDTCTKLRIPDVNGKRLDNIGSNVNNL